MAVLTILKKLTESHCSINRVFQAIHNTVKTLKTLVNADCKLSS